MLRRLLSRLLLLAATLATTHALAAPGDAAAERKINEAINQHYFATNFDQAETVLLAAVSACGNNCHPRVMARLWMYVGLVRANGKEDRKGAVQAFKRAIALDPGVSLDDSLVTANASAAFAEAGGKGGAAAAGGAAAGEAGPIRCTPEPRDISIGQPIPISCTTNKPAVSGTIFYMVPDGTDWVAELLRQQGGALQGTIPCTALAREGTLRVYVELRDQQAKVIEHLGTKAAPLDFQVVKSSGLPAPSFPGQSPPPACKKSDLKKATRGTKEWGDSCGGDNECKTGLCVTGSCDNCKADKDCASGTCTDGNCALVETPETPEEGEEGAAPGKVARNWVGLHGGADIAIVAGSEVCAPDAQNNAGYVCFYQNRNGTSSSTQYIRYPYPGYGGKLNAGLAAVPIMVSYDRLFGSRFTLGARIGYAVGGNGMPPKQYGNAVSFLPVHAEARAAIWLGRDPFVGTGVRPYFDLGVGLATGNVKGAVQIYDCWGGLDRASEPTELPTYRNCANGRTTSGARPANMEVFKTMGPAFGAVGGGVMFAMTPTFGIQVNLNVVVFFPVLGFAVEPTVGPAIGF